MSIKKYVSLAILSIVGFGMGTISANAATDFMIDWQTKTYVPVWYEGKVFPTYESPVVVSFELVEDGKIVDLSETAVRWYVDGKLIKNETNGLGIKRATVFNKIYGGGVSNIKIALPSYKGQSLEKTFDIPVKAPEVVIDVPYFQKKLPKGENTLYAWPFFFNTADGGNLNLQWRVNGNDLKTKKVTNPSLFFTVGNDIEAGTKSTIEARITNQRKDMENINKNVFVEAL